MAAYMLLEAMNQLPRPKTFKQPRDPNEMDDFEFRKKFRLPRPVFNEVLDAIREDVEGENLQKTTAMTPEQQLMTALRYYGTGSYQQSVASDMYIACSQGQVSKIIAKVSNAIVRCLSYKLSFPTTDAEKNRNKQQFYNYKDQHFPGIIGAIDGTQVQIQAPNINSPQFNQGAYFCHKGFYSLNTLIVCDPRMRIINIDPTYPGSTHDSYVWRMSVLRQAFEEGRLTDSEWLLGDSGYPLEAWLLPPIANPENEQEEAYNEAHKSTRAIVERCIGILKMRFRCLTRQRYMLYAPDKAATIITVCAILHNMCRDANDAEELPKPDEDALSDLDESEDEDEDPAINIPPAPLPAEPNATDRQLGRRNQLRVVRTMELAG